MHVKARASSKPGADSCGLVGPVVVHDQVNVQISRDVLLDGVQEAQKLGRPMSRLGLSDDLSGSDVERWLCTLTTRYIRRGTHRSTRELEKANREYLAVDNEDPKPFKWIKSADDILASVKRFCPSARRCC